jgi:hypothetical protein
LYFSYRAGSRLWARAGSGYDLRTVEDQSIRSVREKITPPNFEINLRPVRDVTISYRQTTLLYPVRRPQTTQFAVDMGDADRTHLSSGWSYNVGTPGQLQLRHGASFFLTKGWWLDGGLQYNARGPGKMKYDSIQFVEKYLILKRNLHCWKARIEYRNFLNDHEIFFRLDLATNVAARNAMTSPDEEQFYPARERETLPTQ